MQSLLHDSQLYCLMAAAESVLMLNDSFRMMKEKEQTLLFALRLPCPSPPVEADCTSMCHKYIGTGNIYSTDRQSTAITACGKFLEQTRACSVY